MPRTLACWLALELRKACSYSSAAIQEPRRRRHYNPLKLSVCVTFCTDRHLLRAAWKLRVNLAVSRIYHYLISTTCKILSLDKSSISTE